MNRLPTQIPQDVSEEVDLLDIAQSIWNQRLIVFISLFLAGVIGTFFVFLPTKIYEVSSVLRPTAINDLDALNRSEVYTLPPAQALAKLGTRLESYEARLGFFKNNPDIFKKFQKPGQTLEQGFESFNRDAVSISSPDPKKNEPGNYIRLALRYPDGVDGASILNGFVDYALNIERAEISADLKVIVDNRISEVKGKIKAARSNYDFEKETKIAQLKERDELLRAKLKDELDGLRLQMKVVRNNRITELAEAIKIAKAMGIQYPTTPSSMGSDSQRGSNQIMRTEVNNQSIPLYFMGVKALELELDVLRQRSNDDFTSGRIAEISKEMKVLEVNREVQILNSRENEDIFLQNIEPLRTELARLRSINTDMTNLNLVAIDQRAQEPVSPVKRPKVMIMVLSLFVGLMLGVMAALVREKLVRRRNLRSLNAVDVAAVVHRE